MNKASLRRNQLQEEQRAQTRRLIMQAALKVFAERGYVGSSVEHVLVAAGVSRAAFYSHFEGKLGVVCAIAEDFEPAWRPVFQRLADLRNPTLPDLIEWAASHLDQHRANFETCTLLTQVTALEESLYWQVSRQRDRLIDLLAESHAAFAAARHDSTVLLEAHILLSGIDQTCFHVVRRHLPDPGNTAARIMAFQMLNFLQSHGG